MRDIILVALGAVIMRYVILNTPDYRQKEATTLDDLQNRVHDLIKKYAPEADDVEVGNDVINTVQ
jgi:hypothetical protein